MPLISTGDKILDALSQAEATLHMHQNLVATDRPDLCAQGLRDDVCWSIDNSAVLTQLAAAIRQRKWELNRERHGAALLRAVKSAGRAHAPLSR